MSEQEVLEQRFYISRLYDLYGALLTERQRRVYELRELDDLSLSEIAAELSISRQGVSDQLQRVRDRLEELEKLLGFHSLLQTIEREAELIGQGGAPLEHAAKIAEACRGRTMNDV